MQRELVSSVCVHLHSTIYSRNENFHSLAIAINLIQSTVIIELHVQIRDNSKSCCIKISVAICSFNLY